MRIHREYELTFILIPYFLLLVIGIVEVWSSSRYFAYAHFHDANFFLKRELFYTVLALLSTAVFSLIDYRIIRKITPYLIFVSLGFLLLIYFGYGVSIRGATRWVRFGFQFEPSQIAELVLLIYIADFISRKELYMDAAKGIAPVSFVVGVFFLLIALEPDVGTAFLILITFLTIMYVAGYSVKKISQLLFPSILVLALIIYTHPSKLERIRDFFMLKKISLQVEQSLIAIGSGGLFGHGIGAGNYKNIFIPDSYNDFIMAGIGEDFGFFGIMIVVLMFSSIVLFIFNISNKSKDMFAKVLAFGIATILSYQALINLFSVFSLMPPKGITMPFLSYGGTSLIIQGVMIGIVINIHKASHGKETDVSF
jgi:cell division protein FtsW